MTRASLPAWEKLGWVIWKHQKNSYKWCLQADTEGTRKRSERHLTIFTEDNATGISLDADIPLEILSHAVNLTSAIYHVDFFYAVVGGIS